MATHSRIFAWKIPQRSLEGYSPCDCKDLDTTEMTEHTHTRKAQRYPAQSGTSLLWSRTRLSGL